MSIFLHFVVESRLTLMDVPPLFLPSESQHLKLPKFAAGPAMHTRAAGPVPAISLSTELPDAVLEAVREIAAPQPSASTPKSAATPRRQPSRSANKRQASANPPNMEQSTGTAKDGDGQPAEELKGESSPGTASGRAKTGNLAGQSMEGALHSSRKNRRHAGVITEGTAVELADQEVGEASSPRKTRGRAGLRVASNVAAASVANGIDKLERGVTEAPDSSGDGFAEAKEAQPAVLERLQGEHDLNIAAVPNLDRLSPTPVSWQALHGCMY